MLLELCKASVDAIKIIERNILPADRFDYMANTCIVVSQSAMSSENQGLFWVIQCSGHSKKKMKLNTFPL